MSVKPIKASVGGGGDFEMVPAGTYLARCFKMIDMGTQMTTGKFAKKARQVMLYWEILLDEDGKSVRMESGENQPFVISKLYTLSMNAKASLRKDLDSWRGIAFTDEEAEGFDITQLLNKYCMLQVVHNKSGDKTYSNVGAIMNTKKTEQGINDPVSFSMEDPDMEVFEKLPEWIQNKLREADEWSVDTADGPVTQEGETKVEESQVDEKPIDISDVPF